MSANQIFECVLCPERVLDSDRMSHAASHGDPTHKPRADIGGAMMSDARYAYLKFRPLSGSASITTAGKISAAGLPSSLVNGLLDRRIMTTRNGTMAAGARILPSAINGCLEYIKKNVGFEFDHHSFMVSFAMMYALTAGSNKKGEMGSAVLAPSNTAVGATPQTVNWSEIAEAIESYGSQIRVTMTLRKFAESASVWDTLLKIYENHDDFSDLRKYGTIYSNANCISPSRFWQALPSYWRNKSTEGESEHDRQLRRICYDNAVPEGDSGELYSGRFDPTHQRTNLVPQQHKVLSPAEKLTANMALQGMAGKLA